MSHSKRNTSLAFFTNYERSQLKDRWGSQKARLTRESFLPLAACHLCLQSAREPVACRDGGHIFCRECAVTNLLAQKNDIQRTQREEERKHEEDEENEKEKMDADQQEVVRGFERTMMGLEPDIQNSSKRKHDPSDGAEHEPSTSRRKIKEEKNSKSEKNFWMPATNEMVNSPYSKPNRKLHPVCPSASSKDTHPLSLKSLITVNFTTSTSPQSDSETNTTTTEVNGQSATIMCPACKKGLSSSSKAVLTVPCGHVICKPCVDKFMKIPVAASSGKHSAPLANDLPLTCYVCQMDLTEKSKEKKKDSKSSKEKERVRPGLVQLSSSGTGFASGGKAVVDKEGLAFQC